jgi:predicted ATPase
MSERPTLRIKRFFVQNFRTFGPLTEIPISPTTADAVAVFHGENGSGKSNALAALDFFFRAVLTWLAHSNGDRPLALAWGAPRSEPVPFVVDQRDWPPGLIREPMVLQADFADARLGNIALSLTPSGSQVVLSVHQQLVLGFPATTISQNQRDQLRTWLETPQGLQSCPLFWLDARRRETRVSRDGQKSRYGVESPLSRQLIERLYALATSLIPIELERWRAFSGLVSRFPSLCGHELTIVKPPESDLELRLERRGVQVLRHMELSSGEQQVLGLCAAILTSGAAIVAIEEPEVSLSPANQELLLAIIREQVAAGLVDQVILESHVQTFDGPDVVRFERVPNGLTQVKRGPSEDAATRQAREVHPDVAWVTRDGYTQLPPDLRRQLGVENGGNLWFLPDGDKHWRAWTAEEIQQQLFDAGPQDSQE